MRLPLLFVLAMLLVSQTAFAIITFTQLADDIFVVSHRVKFIGSRAQAMRLVYDKAASLCVAAGYSHYLILDQESEASQFDDDANASVRIQLFLEGGTGRVECGGSASEEYVAQAREKLAKRGYRPPEPEAASPASKVDRKGCTCTIEQIAGMARSGLSDKQIKAACPDC